ncbi:unnamed protein product [Diamesa tonsa]
MQIVLLRGLIKVNVVDEKVLNIAKKEVREDNKRREQSLVQFREWIDKHPAITNCRKDDVFLLEFLRTKKFSNAQAFQLLENFLAMKMSTPEWFYCADNDLTKMEELLKTGYIYPLKERDSNGRRTVIIRSKNLDPERFTSADAIRASSLVFATLMEEEETQIAGFNFIIDNADTPMKIISLFSISDIRNFLQNLKSSSVGRFKSFYVINLPSYAKLLFDIAKGALSEKLRKRIIIAKDLDELKTYINEKQLPAEYGGAVTEKEMLENFKELTVKHRVNLEKLNELNLDLHLLPGKNQKTTVQETIGSFRKLDID